MAALIFLITQKDSFRESILEDIYTHRDGTDMVKVSMLGDHYVEQKFRTKSDALGQLKIRFFNPAGEKATGKITVTLKDPQDKEVASTELDASLLNQNKSTKFILGGDSAEANFNRIVSTQQQSSVSIPVTENEYYTIGISAEDISSPEELDLVLDTDPDFHNREADTYNAVIDGEECADSWVKSSFIFLRFPKALYKSLLAAAFAALIFILIPFEIIDEKLLAAKRWPFDLSKAVTRIMFVAAPLVSYFVIQLYSGFSIEMFLEQLLSPEQIGLFNLFIIGLIWWLIYTLSNRVRFTSAATVLIASGFGLANYALTLFRDTPLIATDIAQLNTAMQVAGSYSLTFDRYSITAIVISAIWILTSFAPAGHAGLPIKKRLIPVIIFFIWSGAFYYMFFSSSLLKDRDLRVSGFKPRSTYVSKGSALAFVITATNTYVKKPEDYFAADIKGLAQDYPSDTAVRADEVSADSPNVIIVMNESFADLSLLGEFDVNKDYMPFYRSLSDNTVKGWMHPSVFGGSTANTEFEALTGFSVKYIPFMAVAYRSVLKDNVPSLSRYFTSEGYGGNIAFHPGMADSYNRDKAYPRLGFDSHLSFSDLDDPEMIRDYVSDDYNYKIIEEEYEKYREENPDAPFFLFNVTIQNHGGYERSSGIVDNGLRITSEAVQNDVTEQYLNLISISDEALKGLIDYFSTVDEDTVILFFGDHQPRLSNGFYNLMRRKHHQTSDLKWSEYKHQVPFMIWSNYDMENGAAGQEEDIQLSANYLGPYLKSVIGMPLTGFDKYLLDLHEELPVINAVYYKDSEGNIYDPDKPSEYDDKIAEYERIQYNGLIDSGHRCNSFFKLKKSAE